MSLIEVKDLFKIYCMGGNEVRALDGVSLKLEAGEFLAIMGPSGSGKSTMLQILGLLDTPDTGSYQLLGMKPMIKMDCIWHGENPMPITYT